MAITLNNLLINKLKNTTDSKQISGLLHLYANYPLQLPSIIKRYHDLLLWYCAFPINKEIEKQAMCELKRIAITTNTIYNSGNERNKKFLMGSGIANSQLLCAFSSSIASWLANKFPVDVELGFSEASEEEVRNIFQSLLPVIEYEKATQRNLGLTERIKFISVLNKPKDQLQWLLQFFEECQLPALVKEELYRQLKVYIKWQLKEEYFNRSFLRWPVKKIFYQEEFIKKVNSTSIIKQKIGLPVLLSLEPKKLLLDTMKASLAFQCRETDPVTYADIGELELFDMGRGLQIAIVGMKKERRLALESYFGFMAFKNGVPISYGGGWIWGQRCKIGVNIYPAFRSSESAWLFCQVMRVYYQHFGVRYFVVKSYQFGKGNREGLMSGAFWFYYKLGFRPANNLINKATTAEWEKIKHIKNYRSPLKLLQYFTAGNLEWILSKTAFPSFDAGEISAAVSAMINQKFSSDRKLAINAGKIFLKNNFPAASLKYESFSEQQVMDNWSLLTLLMNDAKEWNKEQKKVLVSLIKLKQTGKERDYVMLLKKQDCLWKSFNYVLNKK